MDSTSTLDQLKKAVDTFVQERDWQQYHAGKNLAISITCEAAELLELFQWIDVGESDNVVKNRNSEVKHELADIIIVVLSFCNRYNIDISDAVLEKIEVIKQRYPIEKSKGKFTKYTHLD